MHMLKRLAASSRAATTSLRSPPLPRHPAPRAQQPTCWRSLEIISEAFSSAASAWRSRTGSLANVAFCSRRAICLSVRLPASPSPNRACTATAAGGGARSPRAAAWSLPPRPPPACPAPRAPCAGAPSQPSPCSPSSAGAGQGGGRGGEAVRQERRAGAEGEAGSSKGGRQLANIPEPAASSRHCWSAPSQPPAAAAAPAASAPVWPSAWPPGAGSWPSKRAPGASAWR